MNTRDLRFRRFRRRASRGVVCVLAALVLLGTGCTRKMKIARHTDRADRYFNEARPERAEIEYLNILQLDPKNVHACSRLGAIYLEQGRHGQALPHLLRVRDLAPDQIDDRIKLAELFLAGGAFKEAFEEAAYVLAHRPGDPFAPVILARAAASPELVSNVHETLNRLPSELRSGAPVLCAEGILRGHQGARDEARDFFQRALNAAPDYAEAHAGLASCYEAAGDFEAADAAYGRAAAVSGPRSRHRIEHARFKFQHGDLASAQRILDDVTREAPNYLPAILKQAEIAGHAANFTGAHELLKKALAIDGNHPEALLLSSRLARAQGELQPALAAADKFSQLYPSSPKGFVEAARTHLAMGKENAALSTLQRALGISPGYPDAVILLAGVDFQKGNRQAAIAALRPLVDAGVRSVEAYTLLAEAYRALDNLEAALDVHERLESTGLGDDKTVYQQGVLLLQMDRPRDAFGAFETSFSRNPSSVPTLERLIELDLSENQSDTALHRVQKALKTQPADPDLHVLAAKVHLGRHNPVAAEAALKKAIELDPRHLGAQGMLVGRYMAIGDTARAIECLKTMVRFHPQDVSARMFLGSLHEQRKEYAEARATYEEALKIQPRLHQAMNNLAWLFSEYLGDAEKAYSLARRAQDLAPDDPYVADTFAWILHRRGEFSWALALLKEAVGRLPDVALVHYHLASTHYTLGDEASARRSFETALSLDPEFSGAEKAREYLAILNIDPMTADGAAVERVKQHIARQPEDPIAFGKLAALLERSGDLEGAISIQEKAARLEGRNLRALLALARLYLANGDAAQALKAARRAWDMAPDDDATVCALGRMAFEAGDHPWAFYLLQQATSRQPRNASAFYDLADAAFSVGRLRECRGALRRALALSPAGPVASSAEQRLAFLDATEQATVDHAVVKRAREAIELKPRDVAALLVLAASARERKDVEAQRECLDRVLAIYPHFSPAKRLLTLLLAEHAIDDQRALKIGTQAHEIFPDDAELTAAFGRVVYRSGDYKRAATLLETAVLRLPSEPMTWYYLGLSQARLNRLDDARESLNKALHYGLDSANANEARRLLAKAG